MLEQTRMRLLFQQSLMFLLWLCILSGVLSAQTSSVVSGVSGRELPDGHPDYCFGLLRGRNGTMLLLEALPGKGWDNLRNKEMGMIVQQEYTQCRTTPDGKYLIPDGISVVPVKQSEVDTVAEMFDHWGSYTSATSTSINVEVGLFAEALGIAGSYSHEHSDIKKKQEQEDSVTVRMQLRYVNYIATLENGHNLNHVFRGRLRKIAADVMRNRTRMARYESEMLVRDYGTHVINSVDIGAALVKTDQIKSSYAQSTESEQTGTVARAGAAAFFEDVPVNISVLLGYKDSVSEDSLNGYKNNRQSSETKTYGGGIFKPQGFSAEDWSNSIDNNLVAMDRNGYPLHLLVGELTLSKVPEYATEQVYHLVKDAVVHYHKHNTYRGCTKRGRPNFSFKANLDDGNCELPNTNFTFGGVYQTCTWSGYTNICDKHALKNPLTGDFSCPDNYVAVEIAKGSLHTSRTTQETYRCGFFHLRHCTSINTDYADAYYQAFWCAAKGQVSGNTGYMFGGLHTSTLPNFFTQTFSCPNSFFALNILSDLSVCVSNDYELGPDHALPFAGFISCNAGNPLAIDEIQRPGYFSPTGDKPFPHQCPNGYSQHLAVVENGCEVEFCAQSGIMKTIQLPNIRLPPFTSRPSDIPRHEVKQQPVVVFSEDGTVFSTLQEEMAAAEFTPSVNDTVMIAPYTTVITANGTLYHMDESVTQIPPKIVEPKTNTETVKQISPLPNNPEQIDVVEVIKAADSSTLSSGKTEVSTDTGLLVGVALASMIGTFICVMIVIVFVKFIRNRDTSPYQKI